MDNGIILQYVIIAIVVLGAGFALYKKIRKSFAAKRFDSKSGGCDKNCGCS